MVTSSSVAIGQSTTRSASLSYERQPEAEGCPELEELQSAVAARLGYDPFLEDAELALRLVVRRSSEGFEARIEARRGEELAGERVLESSSSECGELAESIVLATSIAIDPAAAFRAPEPSRPPATPRAPPAPPPPPKPPTPAAPSPELPASAISLDVRLGVAGSLGLGPGATAGLRFELEVLWPEFALGVGGRADLPSSARVAGGSIYGSVMLAELAGCKRVSALYACAVVMGGIVRAGAKGLPDAEEVVVPHVGVGGRIGLEHALTPVFVVRGQLDVAAPITQTTLLVGDEIVWSVPLVSGSLSIVAAFRFS